MNAETNDVNRPEWDDDRARNLSGAVVLIGLTRVGPGNTQTEQMFGTIAAATAKGIEVALNGTRSGELFTLPPDLTAFHPAPPGDYRLRGTGEVVTNPDFTTTWEIQAKEDDSVG